MRARLALTLATALAASGLPAYSAGAPRAAATDPASVGQFSAPFEEPGPACRPDGNGGQVCKPAAVSAVALASGNVLYWDGLEGMEDVRTSTVLELGEAAGNDLSRVVDLRGGGRWWVPAPADGGSNPRGNDNEYLPGPLHNNDDVGNDGDLFCSAQVHLFDGRVLNTGGTSYYNEPGIPGVPYGVVELEGLKNSKVFDTARHTWLESGRMNHGRWYPTLVTLADGKIFVASGVTKLVKPVYADHPTDSGTNVRQTETYNPWTHTWALNHATADRSLPLFPRLHLLPDGKVYYDAGGQTFNPSGQSYDEATWAIAAVYDPATQKWSDLGIPAFGNLVGFRGSGFSQMLTLRSPYTTAQFLSAGGVYGQTPGTYLATNTATLNTVTVGARTGFKSEAVGTLNNARWYSTGVTLPTGQVLAFSGADRDEVVGPGTGKPVTQVEMYDPQSRRWTALASSSKGRTYHNTAILLQDGRVLLGGHAPINTGYAHANDTGHRHLGLSASRRDASFEIYSPPNLFYGERPTIRDYATSVPYGRTMTVKTTHPGEIGSVVLVRNPALTHLVDADQRVVELPVVARDSDSVTVWTPPQAAVAPAGPYWLFVNRRTSRGLTPSVGRQVFVGTTAPAWVQKVPDPFAPKPAPTPTASKPPSKDDGKGKKKGHDKDCGKGKCHGHDATTDAADTPSVPASSRTPAVPLPLVVALGGAAVLSVGLRRWRPAAVRRRRDTARR